MSHCSAVHRDGAPLRSRPALLTQSIIIIITMIYIHYYYCYHHYYYYYGQHGVPPVRVATT